MEKKKSIPIVTLRILAAAVLGMLLMLCGVSFLRDVWAEDKPSSRPSASKPEPPAASALGMTRIDSDNRLTTLYFTSGSFDALPEEVSASIALQPPYQNMDARCLVTSLERKEDGFVLEMVKLGDYHEANSVHEGTLTLTDKKGKALADPLDFVIEPVWSTWGTTEESNISPQPEGLTVQEMQMSPKGVYVHVTAEKPLPVSMTVAINDEPFACAENLSLEKDSRVTLEGGSRASVSCLGGSDYVLTLWLPEGWTETAELEPRDVSDNPIMLIKKMVFELNGASYEANDIWV